MHIRFKDPDLGRDVKCDTRARAQLSLLQGKSAIQTELVFVDIIVYADMICQ